MNPPTAPSYVLPRWLRPWEQFWFTPADPTVLALIRIACGMLVVYTLFAYTFKLQEFMGEHGWIDMQLQRERVDEAPWYFGPLDWTAAGQLPAPKGEFQTHYLKEYRKKWGVQPPPPYPTNEVEAQDLDKFRSDFGVDLRINGLPIPTNSREKLYALEYTKLVGGPPPAYPQTDEEARAIAEYYDRFRVDPRLVIAKGATIFSIWFHVTDPTAMAVVHCLIVVIAFLFTIGFCTRITSALIWFASLCYIHRNPTALFGVDTMMTILLFYLMMGPCGAAFSIDRLIRKWWVTAKPGVVQWWYGLLKRPMPTDLAPADPVPDEPAPTIGANVAMRLLQIHVCIIYLFAGVSKLLGASWWNGSAIWSTLGNFEFAPMQFELYLILLRFLGKHQLFYDSFMTFGGYFTLIFEVGYAFLIWRPKLRWMFLGAAIMLHGGIGLFMGLKTFSLMMLVMNMAFLRKEEAYWLLTAPFSFMRSPSNNPIPKPVAATK
jgi:hypothetical protein